MKKHKIYFCLIILFFIFIMFPLKNIFAKYMFSEAIIVANINIDRTKPKVEILYSEKNITNDNVVVTIKANEEVKQIEGWQLQEDKKTLIKEYKNNIVEEIEIQDLSGNKIKEIININQIDREAPIIEISTITNSNTKYPQYANKDKTITALLTIKDNISISEVLKESDIKIIVGNEEITPKEKKLEYQKNETKEKIAKLTLKGIEKEGILKIQILQNTIKDDAGNVNIKVDKSSNITIDNTKPKGVYSQNKIEAGKIQAIITANEPIKNLDGWSIENNNVLKKVFNNNLSYTITIEDLAGNKAEVEINITGATNVIISYASHNSMIGWSYGYGNYDIAGLNAIKADPKYKTESLAFSISGNVEKDYLQAKAFVYTHWGEGSQARCADTGKIYSYGWNPSNSSWKYQTKENEITLNGKTYFQFGGAAINGEDSTDINGNGTITHEIGLQLNYGISAIQMKLKNYDDNSILYQVYIDKIRMAKTS